MVGIIADNMIKYRIRKQNGEEPEMDEKFFLDKMADLMGVCVCQYDCRTKEKQSFGKEGGIQRLPFQDAETLEENLQLGEVEFPMIRMSRSNREILFVQIRDPKEKNAWYLIGPVAAGMSRKEYLAYVKGEKGERLKKSGFSLRNCRIDDLVSGVLLLYWYLTGNVMDTEEFWSRNEKNFCESHRVWERVEKDIFDRQEQYGPHNPYEQELRELESIRTGDVEALNFSIAETYEGQIGTLAKDPLRHHKNIAVGNITLASRSAIRGGISKEWSFSMADSFIQQIEELDSVPAVIALKREAQRAFALAVHQEQDSESQEELQNPLIAGVKDYIFSHLHDSIRIADIAKHLNVNADYLSHLFKTSENITIKQYIQKEKIRRGKNLLRYSDASIHEIAFYLGFSSQSHFTNVFQKTTGETPNYYRKQFLDRRSWKIWDNE